MTQVIRDFLDDVDDVLEFADTLLYHHCNYFIGVRFAGLRSDNVIELCPDIKEKIHKETGYEPKLIYFHKHENLEHFKPIPHVDKVKHAGVIYLRGGFGCGTIVDNELHIYGRNKLICYEADRLHQPEGFSEDRLVITFFC